MAGNDSFTKVLLHLDGANGSTTIADTNLGGSAHTWTAGGNAIIGTSQAKFGTASATLDGTTGTTLTASAHSDFNLGSGDFTVDFWFFVAGGLATSRFFGGQSNSALNAGFSYLFQMTTANVVMVYLSADGTTATTITGTTAYTTSGWHHLAFVRTGNTLKLFLDGTQEGGNVTFATAVNSSSNKLGVGSAGELTASTWPGFIDEFRISVGVARWTANFTPPTTSYGPADFVLAQGSYTLTGQAVTLTKGYVLAALQGAYAIAGQAINLIKSMHLTAVRGSYTLTGFASSRAITRLTSVGVFALTGFGSNRAVSSAAAVGHYVVTGFATGRLISAVAASGAYTLTGFATKRLIVMAADAGSYVLTGITLVAAHLVAPVSKFKIRITRAALSKIRGQNPTLTR